jgi:hypothetical protein
LRFGFFSRWFAHGFFKEGLSCCSSDFRQKKNAGQPPSLSETQKSFFSSRPSPPPPSYHVRKEIGFFPFKLSFIHALIFIRIAAQTLSSTSFDLEPTQHERAQKLFVVNSRLPLVP